jgi:hypothetical protein
MTSSFILVRVANFNGKTVLQNLNTNSRSLNPDGSGGYIWQERPTGIAGMFEECAINGSLVVYNPLGVQPVIFKFVSSVPGGFSALDPVSL